MQECSDAVSVPLYHTGGRMTGPLSLYLHIPFCVRKCRYCDFLSGPQDQETREAYVRSLIREIEEQSVCPRGTCVDTVFFGGGTPSVLTGGQVAGIMEALKGFFSIREDAEISMEMNPGTADAEKLLAFKSAGINRLSMGVQSMRDDELRTLGRIHTAQEARSSFELARKTGFDNINVDLMSALPGQSFESWQYTLGEAVRWAPEHISAYSLIIEPGTPFASMYENGTLPPLPDEDTDREMYHFTKDFLAEHGYLRYEISNYALAGRECRHNSGYWTGHPYLGFGIGAASYVNGTRFSNDSDLSEYLKAFPGDRSHGGPAGTARAEQHRLSGEEQMEEFMFLGLRMTAGVKDQVFFERFGEKISDIYGPVLDRHISQGVLERTEGGYRLTDRGVDVSNYVLADYLLE